MREAKTILGLIQERGKKGLPLERVYKLLFEKDLYLKAYGKIYRNKGAMTHGVTDETPDGMSLAKIDAIIEALRYERYQWLPARRTFIPKKNGKKRPLGMPVWSDKLLQEVVRQLLEAYFEPQLSDHSHGLRPKRGCHTALREIYHTWQGTVWFIEGDISQCFDKLSHKLLLDTLSKHIHDGRFINLIRELLDAGYMEDWTFNQTLSGVPQGGILSPMLSNILLNQLDTFVETVLLPTYTKGVERKLNPEYKRLTALASYYRRKGNVERAEELRKQFQQLPSKDSNDPEYRRLKYVRYADDFLLGFIKKGKAMHRTELLENSDYTIMTTYQLEYRGITNYYQLAYNKSILAKLRKDMENSLVKTLSSKHKMTVRQTYKKYRAVKVIHGEKKIVLQATLSRKEKQPLVATWGGIPLKWNRQATLQEQPPKLFGGRTELEQRILAEICELCGATDKVEVHHVRAMNTQDGKNQSG
jgi:group II intron reverse transcriptase/maturase